MKQKRWLSDLLTQGLLALYVYALFEIILFKSRSIDPAYLWHQLKMSIGHPGLIVRQLHQGNLVPFREISHSMQELTGHGLINLVGNVVIFMPFGLFLGLLSKRMSFAGAFLYSMLLSLILESSQAVFAIGVFDVDDLILNASGGLAGWIALQLWIAITRSAPADIQARGGLIKQI